MTALHIEPSEIRLTDIRGARARMAAAGEAYRRRQLAKVSGTAPAPEQPPEPSLDDAVTAPEPPALRTSRDETLAVIAEVAETHGITVADILGKSREWRHCHPRQKAMSEVFHRRKFSLSAVARLFGCDHTTVLHSIRVNAKRAGQHDIGSVGNEQ